MTVWFWECGFCRWQGGKLSERKAFAKELAAAHDRMFHRGTERTFAIVRQRKLKG